MARTVRIASEEETERWGRRIADLMAPSDVLLLEGELGVGKTTLARAVVYGLGVSRTVPVTSPTFALVHEYPEGRLPVWHVDLFRLGGPDEVEELGLQDESRDVGVVLVEWGKRFEMRLPAAALELRLEFAKGDARDVRIEPRSERGERLLAALPSTPLVA